MYLLVNILGIIVFLGIAFIFSKNKKEIKWRSVITVLVLNLVIAYCLTQFAWGRAAVEAAANGFSALVEVAYQGIAFALPNWVHVKSMDFVTSALLPILLIVPVFDILTYIGILPWIIKWVGKGLAYITGQPKFESFFAVEMMFLGNTEALAVSTLQLKQISAVRNVVIAMMSMSCVTASILGAYTQMVPGQYVLTAVPLNILNAVIVTSILMPTSVSPEEDTIAKLGSSSQTAEVAVGEHPENAIITANVIAFVALAALIDKILGAINPSLSLEHILGIIMFPFAWLMGSDVHTAFEFAQNMGTKLVTNEFVVMGRVSSHIGSYAPHYRAQLTVFLTSFANLSTVGMIIGAFKGIVNREVNNAISKSVGYMILSGILVSLLSAGIVGLFVW